jgi:hypothetical protein
MLPAQFGSVQTVYVMPMAGGLDQYVAERLTREKILRVVADPKQADAVLTDRLGDAFEQKMEEIFPGEAKPKVEGEKQKDDRPVRAFATGRGRGTVFLVESKSRHVIWSVYEKPNGGTSYELNRTAGRIVEQMKKDTAVK